MMKLVTLVGCACLAIAGCDPSTPKPTAEPAVSQAPSAPGSAAPSASAAPAASIDPAAVEAATGIKPEVADSVVKVSYPRGDVKVGRATLDDFLEEDAKVQRGGAGGSGGGHRFRKSCDK